jgi:hypothetical protein
MYRLIERTEEGNSRPLPTLHSIQNEEGADRILSLQRITFARLLDWITDANLPAGNSKEGNTNLSFTEASISEEPSAVVPHAGICAGAVR